MYGYPIILGTTLPGVNNFKETYYLETNYWNFSNRTDWNITDKWRVFGRYSQFHNTIDEKHSVQSPAIPRWDGGAMYALNIAANSIYELRPNLVLEVSGSYGSIHDDYDDHTGRMNSQTLASIWSNQWYTPYTKELNPVYYPNFIVGDATFGHGFWWVEHPKNASFRAKMGQNLGKHDLKYGFEYRREFGYISYPSLWTFTFGADPTADTFIQPTSLSGSPYATFLLGALGSAALGGVGDSVAQYISPHQPRINAYGVFFQDNLRLSRRVTLNLGMRYEYSGAMTDAHNRISRYLDLSSPIPEMQVTPPSIPSSITAIAKIPYRWNGAWNFAGSSHPAVYRTSKLGFMPRVGMAFKVNDRTALRAGYARYVIPTGMTQPFQSSMPMSGFTATTNTAPSLEGIPGAVLTDPFPATNPLILPTGSSLGRYQNLGASAKWEAQNFLTGVSDRINVSVQRQLPQQFLLDVTYFVNFSHNLPYTLFLNQMDPQLSYTYKGLLSQSIANPFYQYLTPTTFPGQLRNQSTVTVGSLLTTYPQYGTLQQLNTPGVKDKYYALQIRLQRRFWNGLAILWAYNFSREAKQDWFNAPDQYANRFTYIDSNNPRHRMNVAGTYDLPFGKGRWLLSDANPLVNAIVGGWSSSGIFTYVSGEYLRFGQLNVTGNPAIFKAPDQYFNTSVFSPPTPYTPRTNPWQYPGVTGPRFVNVDATIAKFFAVRERLRLEFRMEAYNATNSFMAKKPSTDINSSLFGRSTGQANIGRQIQYTLQLHF